MIMLGFLFCCCSVRVFLAAHQSARIGVYRKRGLSSACWAVGSEAGDLLGESLLKGSENGSLLSALEDSALVPFGTVDAEITQEITDFFVSDAEGDPDCPSEGYSSIEQALNSLCEGKVRESASCFAFLPQISFHYHSRVYAEEIWLYLSVSPKQVLVVNEDSY